MFFDTKNNQYKLVGGYYGVDKLIDRHDKKALNPPYTRYGKLCSQKWGIYRTKLALKTLTSVGKC